jgi:hypothetical protein
MCRQLLERAGDQGWRYRFYQVLVKTRERCLAAGFRLSPTGYGHHGHLRAISICSGYLQRVIDLDAQVPYGALQLAVPKKELDSADVLGALGRRPCLAALSSYRQTGLTHR